jgi:S-disulfanyl-L-cysteine oxidoreductase SoxD
MPSPSSLVALVALALLGSGALAQDHSGYGGPYPFGTAAIEEEIAAWNIGVAPDGRNLPAGSGTAAAGAEVYASYCAACHGENLEGIEDDALPQGGGEPLVGGRGTLNTDTPLMTVESYWPYATTLYDYIARAMPYMSPSSLTTDEVYSVIAFILSKGGIIEESVMIDAASLPTVEMPNRDGFYPDDRPEPVDYD